MGVPTANLDPTYPRKPRNYATTLITVANTTVDISTGTSYQCMDSDATDGTFVDYIDVNPPPAGSTIATVMRVWKGAAAASAKIIAQKSIPASTASNTAITPTVRISIKEWLPAGVNLYLSVGTAPGGNGLQANCVAYDY